MGKFADAARKGLDAGRRRIEARVAIDRTLVTASRDVSAVVGAEIALRLAAGNIVASADGTSEPLARVEMAEVGFPATLRWDDRVERAADAQGFEAALLRLLESVPIAEAILRVARREATA